MSLVETERLKVLVAWKETAWERVAAIHSYETEHSQFPGSREAKDAAGTANCDFTYGTSGVSNSPSGMGSILAMDTVTGKQLTYQTNNSEIMSVLLDVEHWQNQPASV